MTKYLKYIIFGFLVLGFFSCGKEEVKKIEKKIITENDEEESDTTVMTPAEIFSDALTTNILNDYDEELQVYLEETIYPLASKSSKATIDRVSSSLYLFQYEEGGNTRNILIQKFYNPLKDEYFFEKRDVQSDAVKQFLKQ
ncbi:MAG: hypothetical protein HY959_04765 [Ignavibacteriae bacterium]|nr:hypothetical protein [Ignavibacteriota bacterium]